MTDSSGDFVDCTLEARRRTLQLVEDLVDEQLHVPLLDCLNPFLWELGHVAFFGDAFVLGELDGSEPMIEHAYELYESFTVEHAHRWQCLLPSRAETLQYMERVQERMLSRLNGRDPTPEERYLYRLAYTHEDMHGEAFTYMRQKVGYSAPPLPAGAETAGDVGGGPLPGDAEVPGGTFLLGARTETGFVFDNEKWEHPVELEPFAIARAAVTNAEYAEFVGDEGYNREELWSPRGWEWRRQAGMFQPRSWRKDGTGWLRTAFDALVPLEEHQPVVHVSFWEAEAYARWAGRRLPSEAEWERAAEGPEPTAAYPWGDEPPTALHANLDGATGGAVDVGAYAAGDSRCGCRQMLGNVWEWTSSDFYPYPGYVVDRPYREYSAPWFGDRKVLRGGAWATRARLLRLTYRNFFLPERTDIFAGFRTCACD